jgi:hypothetical protein
VNATTPATVVTPQLGVGDKAATEVFARHGATTATPPAAAARSKARRKHRIRPVVVSMLEIQTVMPDDAGVYTCAPSNARNHSVVVHVIQGSIDRNILFCELLGSMLCSLCWLILTNVRQGKFEFFFVCHKTQWFESLPQI